MLRDQKPLLGKEFKSKKGDVIFAMTPVIEANQK